MSGTISVNFILDKIICLILCKHGHGKGFSSCLSFSSPHYRVSTKNETGEQLFYTYRKIKPSKKDIFQTFDFKKHSSDKI